MIRNKKQNGKFKLALIIFKLQIRNILRDVFCLDGLNCIKLIQAGKEN